MKLYYSPGACSFATHIALQETGVNFETEFVDIKDKNSENNKNYKKNVNPKGYVPALKLDNGEVLTEASAILMYIADLKPELGLTPRFGTFERYRLHEWLTFISSELHKGLGALFNPKLDAASKEALIARVMPRIEFVDQTLREYPYLMKKQITVADFYLYVILRWTGFFGIDMSKLTGVTEFMAKMDARDSVRRAKEVESAKH